MTDELPEWFSSLSAEVQRTPVQYGVDIPLVGGESFSTRATAAFSALKARTEGRQPVCRRVVRLADVVRVDVWCAA